MKRWPKRLQSWAKREDVRFSFKCTQCGQCCTGKGGQVRVNEAEAAAIARTKRMDLAQLKQLYFRQDGRQWLLKQTADDSQCVFLDGKKCSIYEARPTQCRTFPWWPQNLISDYDWRLAARDCEGIRIESSDSEKLEEHAFSYDDVLPQTILHDIHRSGENYTFDQITDLMQDLKEVDPDFVEQYKSEFFAKYERRVVHQDDEVAVLDSFLDGSAPTRCFVFNDRLHLVQSEVTLAIDGYVDRSTLMLDVHRALCVPFAWLTINGADQRPLQVAVLGSGAATLPLFLLEHLEQIYRLDAVEPSAKVNSIAREFFGVSGAEDSQQQKFRLHEVMGEEFVARKDPEAKYDLLVIDVEAGGPEDDVRAPPTSMLQTSFLESVKDSLSSEGMIAINVITKTDEALATVQERLSSVFSHGLVLKLRSNTVFFVCDGPKSPFAACGDRAKLSRFLARDAFQVQRARTPALLNSSYSITVHSW